MGYYTQYNMNTEYMQTLASLIPAVRDAAQRTAMAFADFVESMRPAMEQAAYNLSEAGYKFDHATGMFVRGFGDNPIPVHRLLRYVTRSPQNRRRVKERRNQARRMRRRIETICERDMSC